MLVHSLGQRLECINDPVASPKEHQAPPANLSHGRGAPGAVKNVRRDRFVITGDESSGSFIQDNQAGSIRRANTFMRVVHARAAVEVKIIAIDQNGTVRGVMRPNPGAAVRSNNQIISASKGPGVS